MADDVAVGRRAWAIVGALWATMAFSVAYEIVPASLLPVVAEGLGVDPAAASWLVSVLFLGMALASLPVGIALDRVDNRAGTVVATAVVVLASVWAWRAAVGGAYRSLLVARFLSGVGIVTLWTAGINVVGATFGPRRQATAIGVLTTAVPAGFAIGHFTGSALAGVVGWAGTFPAYMAVAGLAAAAFWVATAGVSVSVDAPTPTRGEFAAVLGNRAVWTLAFMAFAGYSLSLFFNNWLPTYLVERFSLSLAAGGRFAALFPAVGIVARAASGALSDRLFGGRRRPLVVLSFLILAPLIALIATTEVIALLVGALVLAGFLVQVAVTIILPYVREVVAENVVGTALAATNTAGFFGAFVAPILMGELIERTGGYLAAFALAGALALAGLALAWRAPEAGR